MSEQISTTHFSIARPQCVKVIFVNNQLWICSYGNFLCGRDNFGIWNILLSYQYLPLSFTTLHISLKSQKETIGQEKLYPEDTQGNALWWRHGARWWRLKSRATKQFVQPYIEAYIKENIQALRCWPFTRGIHRWLVTFPHKGPETPINVPFMTSSWEWRKPFSQGGQTLCRCYCFRFIISTSPIFYLHDDVIKWKHFSRYWFFVRANHLSSVDSPHKGQWRGAMKFPWSPSEQTFAQRNETPVIWDPTALIMTSL